MECSHLRIIHMKFEELQLYGPCDEGWRFAKSFDSVLDAFNACNDTGFILWFIYKAAGDAGKTVLVEYAKEIAGHCISLTHAMPENYGMFLSCESCVTRTYQAEQLLGKDLLGQNIYKFIDKISMAIIHAMSCEHNYSWTDASFRSIHLNEIKDRTRHLIFPQ